MTTLIPVHSRASALGASGVWLARVVGISVIMLGLMKLLFPAKVRLAFAGGEAPLSYILYSYQAGALQVLSVLEVVLGLLILWPRSQTYALGLATAMFLVYAIGLLAIHLLGQPISECGCFGRVLSLKTGQHLLLLGALLSISSASYGLALGREARVGSPQ